MEAQQLCEFYASKRNEYDAFACFAEKNPWFADLYSVVKNDAHVHIVYAEVLRNWMLKLGISSDSVADSQEFKQFASSRECDTFHGSERVPGLSIIRYFVIERSSASTVIITVYDHADPGGWYHRLWCWYKGTVIVDDVFGYYAEKPSFQDQFYCSDNGFKSIKYSKSSSLRDRKCDLIRACVSCASTQFIYENHHVLLMRIVKPVP